MQPPDPIPGQPQTNGEPTFTAPWQARTFAMAIQLHHAGLFEWKEWATQLANNIAEHEKHGAITNSDDYYRLWQVALEQIVAEKVGAA